MKYFLKADPRRKALCNRLHVFVKIFHVINFGDLSIWRVFVRLIFAEMAKTR